MVVKKVIEGVLRRFQFAFYLYIIIQTYLDKYHVHRWTKIFLQIFLTTIISIFQISLLLLIEAFRQIIRFILYISVEDFEGLLNGQDSVWAKVSEKESKCCPAVLVLIEHENPTELKEAIKKRYLDIFDAGLYQRAYNKINSFCGFFYYSRTRRINVDDHVVSVEFYDSKDTFEDVLGNIINEDFPEKNKSMWKVYVGQYSLNWLRKRSGSANVFPVLYRMHHSMGDGIALLNLFVDLFADDGNTIIKNIYKDMNSKIIRSSSDKLINSKFVQLKWLMSKISGMRYKSLSLKPPSPKEHFLYGPKLSGRKLVSYLSEESPYLMEKVKKIKKKLNISFTDVVNAAISASFADYIEKHYQNSQEKYPEFLSATMVIMLSAMDLAKEASTVRGQLKVKLNNKFTCGNIEFPIKKFKKNDFESHIMDINRESTMLKNSIDLAYNEWQLNIPTPSFITRYIFSCNLGALLISSLPGCGRLKVLNGHEVRDIAFWVPNMLQSGIGVSVHTYDNRFQIGLLVDSVLISERDDVKGILEGVFKYIGLFYQEICKDDLSWNVIKYDVV